MSSRNGPRPTGAPGAAPALQVSSVDCDEQQLWINLKQLWESSQIVLPSALQARAPKQSSSSLAAFRSHRSHPSDAAPATPAPMPAPAWALTARTGPCTSWPRPGEDAHGATPWLSLVQEPCPCGSLGSRAATRTHRGQHRRTSGGTHRPCRAAQATSSERHAARRHTPPCYHRTCAI